LGERHGGDEFLELRIGMNVRRVERVSRAIPVDDILRLRRLRELFLSEKAGEEMYWRDENDLAIYDRFLGERIRWKWNYLFEQLEKAGWSAPNLPILDWGCGSGVAGRAYLSHQATGILRVWDKSALARSYALGRAREFFPRVTVEEGREGGVLLLSHVLNEMNEAGWKELHDRLEQAEVVLWVEPGTYGESRSLVAKREELLATGRWKVVAPCPHAGGCGLLTAQNERHWCHHFVAPPKGIFQSADWSQFAREIGVDLRSVPVSYLVLDRRESRGLIRERVLGRPRIYKGYAKVLTCDGNGVEEKTVQRREAPELLRRWEKRGGIVD
jgi:hypothetical protein